MAILLLQGALSCKKSTGSTAPTGPVYSSISYTGADSLSQASADLAAAGAGTKIVFGGGSVLLPGATTSIDVKTVNIYDVTVKTWTTGQLSEAREYPSAAGAGNKILFAGGDGVAGFSKTVDIYDVNAGNWTTSQLSVGRRGMGAAGAGSKILFAGGFDNTNLYNTVDIYDVNSGQWTSAQLSEARATLAAAGAGSKIAFGGGGAANDSLSATVDIYDVNQGTWTKAKLSQARQYLSAAGAGSKILFGGGIVFDVPTQKYIPSSVVDIYDVNTGKWTTAQLSEPRTQLTAAGAGNFILFAGGVDGSDKISKTVDIYNTSTGVWTTAQLGAGRFDLAAASSGTTLLVGGGGGTGTGTGYSKAVDVFTLNN
jgi:kelch-like protein 20